MSRRIFAEDPSWTLETVPCLSIICLENIAANFLANPVYEELTPAHKDFVQERLSTSLPLQITANLIGDGVYWRRCCEQRWNFCDVSCYGHSWKRMFFERHVAHLIEFFVPGVTKPATILDMVPLSNNYIRRLSITQLLPPIKKPPKEVEKVEGGEDKQQELELESETARDQPHLDHFDFNILLHKLTNLQELHLVYRVKNCGMNFEWSLYEMTVGDCESLGRALRSCVTLKILRVCQSQINDDKCCELVKHLLDHPSLRTLDFSYNLIGDKGAKAISQLLIKSRLETLRMCNNSVGEQGATAIAQALSQNPTLRSLNLRLNRLQDEGAAAERVCLYRGGEHRAAKTMRPLLLGVLGCSLLLAVQALYSSDDDVVELNPSNFNREVIQSDSLWLVEFYAPWCGHCRNLVPDWKKAATALKGVVKVGAVDADQHKSLGGQYGVRGFPTIKVFGANKNKPEEYQGGRSSQAIVDGALSALRSLVKERLSGGSSGSGYNKQQQSTGGSKKDVVELTDDNFDQMVLEGDEVWMVEFFAPWCGHCKNLEPEWAAAATAVKEQTKGKVRLGAVDATVHQGVSGRYGIRGFPTIKIFRKGEEPEDYQGGRTRADIIERALDLFSDNAPAPELLEILNEDVIKTTCEDSQLCVIAVLPHILDTGAEGRNGYLEVMMKMADKYKKKMWGWLWTEAGAQLELEASLGIGGFGYPAMAAINTRKMKYALLRGSFSETGIHEFLRELSVGRGSTATFGGGAMPKIYSVDAWDGKDGQLPVEEEYDLSDVELDDDLGKEEL